VTRKVSKICPPHPAAHPGCTQKEESRPIEARPNHRIPTPTVSVSVSVSSSLKPMHDTGAPHPHQPVTPTNATQRHGKAQVVRYPNRPLVVIFTSPTHQTNHHHPHITVPSKEQTHSVRLPHRRTHIPLTIIIPIRPPPPLLVLLLLLLLLLLVAGTRRPPRSSAIPTTRTTTITTSGTPRPSIPIAIILRKRHRRERTAW
jgi:hypothetical protein